MRPMERFIRQSRFVVATMTLIAVCLLLGVLPLSAQPPSLGLGGQADAPLSLAGTGGLTIPGGEASYHLHALNWTTSFQRNAVITHTLPAGFDYIPGSTQVTVGGLLLSQSDPISQSNSLVWGPFTLPAAGHTLHNTYGIHTFVQDLCLPEFIDLHMDQALELVGSGGYVTQLFYRITSATTGPDQCAIDFVNAAYDRNLVPIIRLQGELGSNGIWVKPDPGPDGSYHDIADAFARYVAGLPLRNTHPLYVTIWNEPDLWIEWGNDPNAQEYGKFFVAVSNAIRELGNSRIRILNGPVTPNNTTFIRQMLQVPGFVNAFDVWASHCYPYNHPPGYNIHDGTAHYLNATIDCYIVDAAVIQKYGGRSGFKFIVKETGYELENNVYGFEGYPSINETLRAQYIADAFNKKWRTWPELIAATPYEMGDPWSGWEKFDWIDYDLSLNPFHFSFEPHQQYDRVSALTKPYGDVVPHGIDITYRAQVDPSLSAGSYPSDLQASAGASTVTLTQTAVVHVTDQLRRLYLPATVAHPSSGIWVMDDPAADLSLAMESVTLPDAQDGPAAIVPTHLLQSSHALSAEDVPAVEAGVLEFAEREALSVVVEGGPPAISPIRETTYVALSANELAVVDLANMVEVRRLALDAQPVLLAPGDMPDLIYVYFASGRLALLNTVDNTVVAQVEDVNRAQSVLFDPITGTVLVADAGGSSLKRYDRYLSSPPVVLPLEDIPGQLLLDSNRRRLFVLLPGSNTVLALNADTLAVEQRRRTTGGPILTTAYDPEGSRLYVLSLLSPRYRGLSVLAGDTLAQTALVAGSQQYPLQQVTAVATPGDDRVMLAEGGQIYVVSAQDFSVIDRMPLDFPVDPGSLAALPTSGQVVWLSGSRLYRYP